MAGFSQIEIADLRDMETRSEGFPAVQQGEYIAGSNGGFVLFLLFTFLDVLVIGASLSTPTRGYKLLGGQAKVKSVEQYAIPVGQATENQETRK